MRSGETIVAEVPVPSPQPGEALVRSAASLVSAGTERMLVNFAGKSLLGKARSRPDLVQQTLQKARREGLLTTFEAVSNRLEQPMPLGYSSAGTIVALGEDMAGFQVGQRVACAGGGYAVHAEFVVIPRNLLAVLPDSVEFEAAAFTTLGAIALHGFRLAETGLGERVAVIGLGLLGMLSLGIAAAGGCQVLGVDLDPRRVDLAKGMGFQAVSRPEAVEAARAFTHGSGCDSVLICADSQSSDPVELAGEIARDRAHVVALGAVDLALPRKTYYEKELSFRVSRSYGPGRYDPAYEEAGQDYPIGFVRWTEGRNMEAVLDLLSSHRLDVLPLITHRFPLDQAAAAYELISGKETQPYLGILLTYPGSAAAASPSAATPALSMPTSQNARADNSTRLGVLGAGNFATAVLLPALGKLPEITLVGIASASGASAQSAADRFGFQYATGDADGVIHDPQVNTVAILTRHHLHACQTVACLEAGKHVFCEKPLALNEAELDQIVQALDRQEQPTLLTAGFNRRFASLAVELQTFLARRMEPLFASYRINAGSLPTTHWLNDPQQGGGRLIGEGIHFIDFLAFLVGAAPLSVSAQALPAGTPAQEEDFVITVSFPDGSLGTVSYLSNGDRTFPKERLEVFCGGRIAVLDDFRSLETVFQGKREIHRLRLRQDKGHQNIWQAFSAAIQAGGPPPIPYAQLFGVARASFAAVQSLRSAQRFIVST